MQSRNCEGRAETIAFSRKKTQCSESIKELSDSLNQRSSRKDGGGGWEGEADRKLSVEKAHVFVQEFFGIGNINPYIGGPTSKWNYFLKSEPHVVHAFQAKFLSRTLILLSSVHQLELL